MIRGEALLVSALLLASPALRAASSSVAPASSSASPTPELVDPIAHHEMQVHFLIASEYYKDGNYQAAIDEWKEVLKIQPNHALAKEKIQKAKERMAATAGR